MNLRNQESSDYSSENSSDHESAQYSDDSSPPPAEDLDWKEKMRNDPKVRDYINELVDIRINDRTGRSRVTRPWKG